MTFLEEINRIFNKLFSSNEVSRMHRRALYLPIFYRSENLGLAWQQSHTLNISESGGNIETFHQFSQGHEIEFEMGHHANGFQEILKIVAEVRWSVEDENKPGQYKCGVAFKDKEVRFRRRDNLFYSLADLHCSLLDFFSSKSQIHPARNAEDLQVAYRLLYQEYSARRLCKPNEAEMFYSYYNLLPGSRTFLLRRDDSLLGTVGCYPESPCGLPMEITYPQEIKRLREQGMKLIEVGCLALNSKYFDKGKWSLMNIEKQAHLFKLFKTIINYTRLYSGATDMVIGCHPKHQTLYKYIFFETIGEMKTHSAVQGTAVLMKMNFEHFVRNTILLQSKSGGYILDKVDTEMLKGHFPWTAQSLINSSIRYGLYGTSCHLLKGNI